MFPPHTIFISEIPTCSFCNEKAVYDGLTKKGLQAFMCEGHLLEHGIGKVLFIRQRPARKRITKRDP